MMTMMLRVVLIVVSVITMTFMMLQDTPGKSSDRSCHVLGDHGADLSSICSGSRSCGSLRKVVRHLFHTKLSVPVYDLFADRKGIWYDHPVVPA